MGPDQRAETTRVRELLYVDQPGWFGAADEPEHLPFVTEAVWTGAVIRVRYQSWKAEVARTLEPLGMVLKGGNWYLVAQDPDAKTPRTYRVSQIRACEFAGGTAQRPAGFDLQAYWREASAAFVRRVYALDATIRVSPAGLPDLYHLGSAVHLAGLRALDVADADGWGHFVLPFENLREAARDVVRLGGEVEVLAPAALRREVVAVAAAILARMPTDADAQDGAAAMPQPQEGLA